MKKFNPIVFLASLGAGGIAVLPFIILQYTVPHGPGLITRSQVWATTPSLLTGTLYLFLEAVMVLFAVLHGLLTIWFARRLAGWVHDGGYGLVINDPLKNTSLFAPLISLLMTMNIFIGPVRYFVPFLSSNFQSLFLPAMILWIILFGVSMFAVVLVLGKAFKSEFDVSRLSFGWLLDSLLLLMLTVVGTGIAAMSQEPLIAHIAGFLSLVSGSLGVFLLLVKVVLLFKGQFGAPSLPEKEYLPSFLIVVPIVTLLGISLFRYGHFLERNLGFHLDMYFYVVVGLLFAFEMVYLLFGVSVLTPYFRKHHFREYFDTQWGLICPVVAFGALSSFVYYVMYPNTIFYALSIASLTVSVFLYVDIFRRFLYHQKS